MNTWHFKKNGGHHEKEEKKKKTYSFLFLRKPDAKHVSFLLLGHPVPSPLTLCRTLDKVLVDVVNLFGLVVMSIISGQVMPNLVSFGSHFNW